MIPIGAKLTIDKIKPEPSDGDDLKNYYFQQDTTTGGFNIYSSDGKGPLNGAPMYFGDTLLVQSLGGGPEFLLTLTGVVGTWSDKNTTGDPGDGTFQAQAGGTGEDEETASSASA